MKGRMNTEFGSILIDTDVIVWLWSALALSGWRRSI